MSILDTIVEYKYEEVKLLKEKYSFIIDKPLPDYPIYSAVNKIKNNEKISIIAEIKKGSPSKGYFAKDLDYIKTAKFYEDNGATCISVLTDEKFFYGSFEILKEIRETAKLPILCKDFIIDKFQIKLAKYHGANLILLIKRILTKEKFIELLKYARELNLEVLVEVDSENEFLEIADEDFHICGVNNRDLSDFTVNIEKTKKLSKLIKSKNKLLISESGIYSKEQVIQLRESNIDGILVGESLIKSEQSNLIKELQIMKNKVKIKICGIRDIETAVFLKDLNIDYIGFVFTKSKRKIGIENAIEIITALREHPGKRINVVGVFTDETIEDIEMIYNICDLDFVQIHSENYKLLSIPKDKVIPAVNYTKEQPKDYNFILIDNITPGSGEIYDLKSISKLENQNYILAGGLNSNNVVQRAYDFNPLVVDISSGVETDGYKDRDKIKVFVDTVGGI